MRSMFRYALAVFTIFSSLAFIACGNSRHTSVGDSGPLDNKTSLLVVDKDSSENMESLEVIVATPEGPRSFRGYINLDGPHEDANILQPTNFTGAPGEISKSILANGEVIIVAKFYLPEDANNPQVIVFSGKTLQAGLEAGNINVDSIKLIMDQNFIDSLQLEKKTGLPKEELIEQLQDWLSLQGVVGVDSFAASIGDAVQNQ